MDEELVSICIPLWEPDEPFNKLIKSIKNHDAGIPYEICIGEGHNSTSFNRNLAMKKARSNIICQLDGDAEILEDGWLKKMYDTLMSESDAGVVGCIVDFPNGKVDHSGTILLTDEKILQQRLVDIFQRYDDNDPYKQFMKKRVQGFAGVISYEKNKDKIEGKVYNVFQCSGVCFLFDRRKTGEFSLAYQKAGWQDVDFFAKVMECGYKIYVDGRVHIKHPNTIRTEEEQKLRDDEQSKRGFDVGNLHTYMIRWGVM